MNRTIEIIPKEGCSGCTACFAICPTGAISMKWDTQGFLYPRIDHDKCIYCSRCLHTCPYNTEIFNEPYEEVYAVKHENKETQLSSTSGGFAAAVTEAVISSGGRAYGVVMNDYHIMTIGTDNIETAQQFKGSKYVQTDLCDSLREVGNLLKQQKKVAFFGTSCHIDGLMHYLNVRRINTENLITVDFFCHGVPSPKLFEEYCAFASRKQPLKTYYFRSKAEGWGSGSNRFSPMLVYEHRRIPDTPLARAWIDLFFSNNSLRPHCYECPYAKNHKRSADITMADFWGLKNALPDFFDSDGVSLVVINTDKGYRFFTAMGNIISHKSTLDIAVKKQGNYHNPSKKGAHYKQFWKDYTERGFRYVLAHYTCFNRIDKLKYIVKIILEKLGLYNRYKS